ncbi:MULTISPECIES: hypothetical protein [unclassified Coleofasciculus]|uniref:hypothetical protein n=1 Tax=Cyanophyceae TaxID=3028117 RepID=UPI001685EFE9|nr:MULTISPECIES: hypothetical protein [unclassified Coleofasciculus]MBD1881123.1 hypothetical protein [Coleofasciculus sp. FACHB-T130]MBD2085675.1 hypothetical protein [Coleofasciculus sp. FACHB-542]
MSAGAGDFLVTGVVEHTARLKRANQKAIAHAKTQAKKPLGFEIFDILAKV